MLNCEARNFYGVFYRHELNQVELKAMRAVLKTSVTLSVTAQIGGRFIANGQSRCAPDFPGSFVTNVERFAGRIEHMIVGPRRKLVFMTVEGPSESRARFGNQKAERWVCNHIDPRLRSAQPFVQHGYIFAAVLGETANAIEKLQSGLGQLNVLALAGPSFATQRREERIPVLRSGNLFRQRTAAAKQHSSCDHL